MTLDATARNTAEYLADQYGKEITYRQVSSSYDPTTGQNTETTTDHTVKTAPPSAYTQRQLDSSQVQVGDLRVILPDKPISFTPSTSDRVVIDGVIGSIVQANPLYSGELVAYWDLQVRK